MVAMLRISEFIERSNAAKSSGELFRLLEEAGSSLGFNYIAYGALTDHAVYGVRGDKAPAVVLNYPSDWVKYYFEHNYQTTDPVVVYTPNMRGPYTWRRLEQLLDLGPNDQLFFNEAREAGLNDGASVPLHGPFGSAAVVSFASASGNADAEIQLGRLQALATQFHTTYIRFLSDEEFVRPPVHLSPRERECLLWSARGKSSWDIGIILNISEYTVNFHIQRAMRKFGTTSRIVAVVQAIRLGLLSP